MQILCNKCNQLGEQYRKRRYCKVCAKKYHDEWKKKNPNNQRKYNATRRANGKHKLTKDKYIFAQRKIKRLCVEYLGGKCQFKPKCLYPLLGGFEICYASFSFHHRNRQQKSFGVTSYIRNKMKKEMFIIETIEDLKLHVPSLVQELDKCDLLCSNCHMRIHHHYKVAL